MPTMEVVGEKTADTIQFLVLEDEEDDAFLVKQAFGSLVGCVAYVCRNASEARAYLNGAGIYADRSKYPFPSVVISDLNLGGETGMEFFEWLQTRSEYHHLNIVLMTGSAGPADLESARKMKSLQVVTKPGNIEGLRKIIWRLCDAVPVGAKS